MAIEKDDLITILGPTEVGKTSFAAFFAYEIGGEIISADSRQVYKEMNLGTGKDYSDYIVHDAIIPCHLIDIVECGYKYNVFEYQKDFVRAFNSIRKRQKKAILCGGTGLYIESILKKYKLLPVPPDIKLRKRLEKKTLEELTELLKSYKKLHNITDIDTKKRAIRAIEIEKYYTKFPQEKTNIPDFNSIIFGVRLDRNIQKQKITNRLKNRLKEGMIDEVKYLLETKKIPSETLIYYGLEYKFITQYLMQHITYEEMFQKLNIAIHQFSKRQMTWFRRMERNGFDIYWLDGLLSDEKKVSKARAIIEIKKTGK